MSSYEQVIVLDVPISMSFLSIANFGKELRAVVMSIVGFGNPDFLYSELTGPKIEGYPASCSSTKCAADGCMQVLV